MPTIVIPKAESHTADMPEVPDTIISITGKIARFDRLTKHQDYFDEQAMILVDALCESLPQGIRTRLIFHLMRYELEKGGSFGNYIGR